MNELDKVIDELIEAGNIEFYKGNRNHIVVPGGIHFVGIPVPIESEMPSAPFIPDHRTWVSRKAGEYYGYFKDDDLSLSLEINSKLCALSDKFSIKEAEERILEEKRIENESANAMADAIREGMK